MKISSKSIQYKNAGYALVITMVFVGVTLLVFGSMMYWISSNAGVTNRNNLFNSSEAAAEGAAETVIAQMDRDFLYQNLNSASSYTAVLPGQTNSDGTAWPIQYSFSDTNGTANKITVAYTPNYTTNWQLLNSSQFSGLHAFLADCQVIVTATPLNQGYNLSATIDEQFQLAAIPIFQFGVFYNMDLDISPGQAMTMNGSTFANGNIWMCPGALMTFNSSVSATLLVTNSDDPNDQQNLTFNINNLNYAGGTPESGVDSLVMPVTGANGNTNPTNDEAILNLPPVSQSVPNDAGYASTNQIYLYNEADLIISNTITGTNGNSWCNTNLTVYYDDYYNSPHLTLIPGDVIGNPVSHGSGPGTTYTTNYFYSFVTNVSFYDYRESATVQAVQIDVSKFNIWYTNQLKRTTGTNSTYVAGYPWNNDNVNDKGHPIDSIYIYNSANLTATQLPAVRVINGTNLPSAYGFTVATPFPIYVLGNYNVQTNTAHSSAGTTNTAYTYPAALMGDSITVLSSAWSDSYSLANTGNNPDSPSPGRNASDDTVNAACLEGIVRSVHSGGKDQYSGGLENFLRLLEDWNGNTLTYNGSIVVMFPSIYATNYWVGPSQISGYPAPYYGVPTRHWGFDANFNQLGKLPPLTPQVKQVVRGAWNGAQAPFSAN